VLLGLLAGACRRESATQPVPLVAAPGSASTAALARAEIAGESRYVPAAHPPVVLRAREDVTLPQADELRVPAELPPALAGRDLRIDASVLVREQPVGAAAPTLAELNAARMVTASAPPIVVRGRDGARPEAVIPLPEGLRGRPGLLTVTARPFPASPVERSETAEVDVPPGARLVFGYGVEEAGWAAGFPPVRFAVAAGDVTLFERRLDPAADARDRRWLDASVDLSPLAGRRVRLVFTTEALAGAPGATLDKSFAVVSIPAVVPPAAPGRPGIVLVSLDTLRARSVGAYGCSRPTTPALDRFAAEGALVRTVVAPVPFTPPSHMSMLTGLEPCAHGVKGMHEVLAPDRLTLAEAFRAAGYETAAFTEDAYLVAANGFDRGFNTYVENRSEESASPGFAAETFAQARAWLATHAAHPFFLFVHTYQVHEPYTPPRAYATLFTDGDGGDANQRALAAYEREVRYTDDLLADLLGALDPQTIVAVTSDHGEAFGEHFWTTHGFDLHDEELLVPLVVRAAGLVPAGRVVEEQVGLVDLAPTLLELAGVPGLPDLQGRSFAGLLRGDRGGWVERPIVSADLIGGESVRTRQRKFIATKKGPLLYDLVADPRETAERAAADAAGVAAARAVLEQAHDACARWQRAHPSAESTARSLSTTDPAWLINRDDIQRKLRSLGYTQ